jgi:hypothetical protein
MPQTTSRTLPLTPPKLQPLLIRRGGNAIVNVGFACLRFAPAAEN